MSDSVQTEQRETMNANEVAAFLKIDITTVRRHVKNGTLPAYRIENTRKYLFYRDEIEDSLIPQAAITD